MKKSLQDKLKKYGTMAAAVSGVAVVSEADAQIVFTDLVPDSIFNNDGDSFNLDLNNDAIIDFQLNMNKSSTQSSWPSGSWSFISNRVTLGAAVGNRFLRDGSGPLAMPNNSTVGSTQATWGTGTAATMANYYWSHSRSSYTYTSYTNSQTYTFTNSWSSSWSSASGNWPGQTDKYLGLEFKILGLTHYGWALLSVDGDAGSFTVKEYAYETVPGASILTGDKGVITSISDLNLINDVNVFVVDNSLNLKVPSDIIGYEIKLIDMLGRTVVNQTISASTSKIDVSAYPKGMYVVLIEGETSAFSEKIMIK